MCKKRAEIRLFLKDTAQAKERAGESKTTYYDLIDEAVDLMRASLRLYQEEWGAHHYKAYRTATLLGRFEYLAGHLSPTSA